MADMMHALAREQIHDRERSIAAQVTPFGDPPRRDRRSHRVATRCGYWLISLGCRLVAPDLRPAVR
jgi:hypothetical protein